MASSPAGRIGRASCEPLPLPPAYPAPEAIHLVTEYPEEPMVGAALELRRRGTIVSLEPLTVTFSSLDWDRMLMLFGKVDVVTPDWPTASGQAAHDDQASHAVLVQTRSGDDRGSTWRPGILCLEPGLRRSVAHPGRTDAGRRPHRSRQRLRRRVVRRLDSNRRCAPGRLLQGDLCRDVVRQVGLPPMSTALRTRRTVSSNRRWQRRAGCRPALCGVAPRHRKRNVRADSHHGPQRGD